ncbi:MAG: SH3 domain-containing protein [Candidatus Omnitrophica bacterium]|nr:SH3 domain-containing protein [Candidatus Omnitrophota bacterium]MDD5771220.1 SH3 domain-containing protein [Candidatus Omnitrophota bacterium]
MLSKAICRITLLGFFLISVFTVDLSAAGFNMFEGQVNATGVNVRVDSTVNSKSACILDKGELVDVVSEAYDWYKIRLPKEAPSYIRKDLLECIDKDVSRCSSAKITADRVNVRLEPDESSWIVGQVAKSTVVNVIQSEGDWYKIEPVPQSYGWVHKKFIDKEIVVLERVPSHQDAPVEPETKDGQVTIEGAISPYGMVLWRKATHKLITSDKKVYLLKGNRKGLDNLNYYKVRVTGKIISPESSRYPIVEIAGIEVLN